MDFIMMLSLQLLLSCQGINLMAHNSFMQKAEKCDITIVIETEKNIDSLTEKQLYKFFSIFDESCANNVEFSEYSNEVLLLVFSKKTDLVVKVLNTYQDIPLKVLKQKLENPVNDKVDLKEIIEKINNTSGCERIKKELIKSITIAIDKSEVDL